jgi:hypothetical protein
MADFDNLEDAKAYVEKELKGEQMVGEDDYVDDELTGVAWFEISSIEDDELVDWDRSDYFFTRDN